jgi:hypothetical protein
MGILARITGIFGSIFQGFSVARILASSFSLFVFARQKTALLLSLFFDPLILDPLSRVGESARVDGRYDEEIGIQNRLASSPAPVRSLHYLSA